MITVRLGRCWICIRQSPSLVILNWFTACFHYFEMVNIIETCLQSVNFLNLYHFHDWQPQGVWILFKPYHTHYIFFSYITTYFNAVYVHRKTLTFSTANIIHYKKQSDLSYSNSDSPEPRHYSKQLPDPDFSLYILM